MHQSEERVQEIEQCTKTWCCNCITIRILKTDVDRKYLLMVLSFRTKESTRSDMASCMLNCAICLLPFFLFVVVFCKCQDYSQCLQLEWMKEWILPQPRDIIGIAVFCLWKWMSTSWVTCYMCISISGSCQICCILYAMTVHTWVE